VTVEFELTNTCRLGAAPSTAIRSRWQIEPLRLGSADEGLDQCFHAKERVDKLPMYLMQGAVSLGSLLSVLFSHRLRVHSLAAWAMDVPRFVNRGGKGDEPGDISVMIPYWVYRRFCDMVVAVVLMAPTYPLP
jgi:hypothetical protein